MDVILDRDGETLRRNGRLDFFDCQESKQYNVITLKGWGTLSEAHYCKHSL